MDLLEAIEQRRSIRSYTDQSVSTETRKELQEFVEQCNEEGNLHMQLFWDQPQAFTTIINRLRTKNCVNFLALVGKDGPDLEERCGYYGEKIVLKATQLGLGTCWYGMGVKKGSVPLAKTEKLVIVVLLGYANQPGNVHKTKPISELGQSETGDLPDWFKDGLIAAQKAPTAMNQQKFRFTLLKDQSVQAETIKGPAAKVDLGIAKLHFEIGSKKTLKKPEKKL